MSSDVIKKFIREVKEFIAYSFKEWSDNFESSDTYKK